MSDINSDDCRSTIDPENGQNMDQINISSDQTSNVHNLRTRRNRNVIIDENFDLADFPSDLDDSDTSEYNPSNSDSDVNKACMSGNTSKKRKLSKNNKGKIVSEGESSDDDDELSSTVSPRAKSKLNTTVSPEKTKYTKKSRIKPLYKHKWWNEKKKSNRNSGLAYEY